MKPLRKRHLQIWSALALLLPVGIVFAWLAIPNHSPFKLLQTQSNELLPVLKHSRDKKQYCINIRTNKENTEWQLEWKNKMALTVPSAVVYKASPEFHPQPSPAPSAGSVVSEGGTLEPFLINDAELIGRIEAEGSYVFPLKNVNLENVPLQFVLYDFIHQQIIDTINFQP